MLGESEIQERLLAELEEAGEENIPTLANTIFSGDADLKEIRVAMKNALAGLINADLVRVAFDDGSGRALIGLSKERSRSVIMQLNDHLVWRSDDGSWTGGLRPWPEIVTTQTGKERAQAILETRGYRWWSK